MIPSGPPVVPHGWELAMDEVEDDHAVQVLSVTLAKAEAAVGWVKDQVSLLVEEEDGAL